MKYILTLLLLIVPLTAFTQTVPRDLFEEYSSLTPTQQIEVISLIAQRAEANAGTLPSDTNSVLQKLKSIGAEDILGIAEIGTQTGIMLGNMARELGIAANEIATTPLGIFALSLITWHFVGEDFMGLIVSFAWLFFWTPLWLYFFFKVVYPITEYRSITKSKWGKQVTVDRPIRKINDYGDGSVLLIGVVFLCVIIGGFAIIIA